MRNRLIPIVWLALFAWSLTGCAAAPPPVVGTILDVTGNAGDRSLPVLTAQMRREGLTAIEVSSDRDDAYLRLAKVRKAWAPVWVAFDAFGSLHDSAAGLYEQGEALTLQHLSELVRAYCGLRATVAEHGHELPDVPFRSCDQEASQ